MTDPARPASAPIKPMDADPGVTSQYVHQLNIQDLNTLYTYEWSLGIPFPLNLTDDQANAIMQTISGCLPDNPYGWKITGNLSSVTTTIEVSAHDYTEIDIPAVPGAPTLPSD